MIAYLQDKAYRLLFRTNLNSWFHQGVIFSLHFVPPTFMRPQQLVAAVRTAVPNRYHSLSMSSVAIGSFLTLDAMMSANV